MEQRKKIITTSSPCKMGPPLPRAYLWSRGNPFSPPPGGRSLPSLSTRLCPKRATASRETADEVAETQEATDAHRTGPFSTLKSQGMTLSINPQRRKPRQTLTRVCLLQAKKVKPRLRGRKRSHTVQIPKLTRNSGKSKKMSQKELRPCVTVPPMRLRSAVLTDSSQRPLRQATPPEPDPLDPGYWTQRQQRAPVLFSHGAVLTGL